MKIISTVGMVILVLLFMGQQIEAQENNKVGDIMGEVKSTDICTYIDSIYIDSYNYSGYTYVIVEELKDYGFNIDWNQDSKELNITRNKSQLPIFTNVDYLNKLYDIRNRSEINKGVKVFDVLYSDIRTYADRSLVNTYNINGKTVVQVEEFMKFGEVIYDDENRILNISIIKFELQKELDNSLDKTSFSMSTYEEKQLFMPEKYGSGWSFCSYLGEYEQDKLMNGIIQHDIDMKTTICQVVDYKEKEIVTIENDYFLNQLNFYHNR